MTDQLAFERALWAKGIKLVAGVDEAGRGALYGPVVAGAVILNGEKDVDTYRDSKTLSEVRREALFRKIEEDGHLFSVGVVSAEEIDRTNILKATLKAMALAVANLAVAPEWLLVDGLDFPDISCPGEAVVKGDLRSRSIAAASIVAKVSRDRMVRDLDRRYPGYGLARNKGYGTAEHLGALRRLGSTPFHRRTFKGVPGERT